MKKLLAIVLLSSLVSTASFAKARTLSDEPSDRSTVLAGSLLILGGVMFGGVFDKMVTEDMALGAGIHFASSAGASVLLFPVYLNYYFMQGNFRPYLGGGFDILTASFGGFSGTGVAAALQGGVEYRGESGFLFRAYPQLLIGGGTSFIFGVQVGYAF